MPPRSASLAALRSAEGGPDLNKLAADLLEPVDAVPMPQVVANDHVHVDLVADVVDDDTFMLPIDELIADANGEIVFDNSARLDSVTLVINGPIIAEGIVSAEHVTAMGDSVAGLHFVEFASGKVLYYPSDLDITFVQAA